MNKTYILPIEQQNLAHRLSRLSGRIYSKTVSTIFKLKKNKDMWLSKNDMEKLIKLYASEFSMHSQSKQGVVQQYYTNLKSFFKSMDKADNPKPPYRTRKFNKVIYKKSAIRLKNGILKLSNGRGTTPLKIKAKSLNQKPKYVEIIYHHREQVYKLHIVVKIENKQIDYDNDKTLAIDLGQIHPMVTFDGKQSLIYNGGKLNSFIRFRNKELAKLQTKMSRCKKYSNLWNKLNRAKKKLMLKSRNKIMDVLQKYTSHLISYCIKNKVSTIVIGDIKGIRENISFGAKTNQKLHQWVYKRLTDMIEYKAKSVGIKVDYQEESYTSQTCCQCGNRHKPTNRNYICKCGFSFHRDSIGAINILKKYTIGTLEDKTDWLEGELTSSYGIRYKSNSISCQTEWNIRPFGRDISA
ncbi:RNA-guided endonuclease InsQ/TnpB family protein [Orenia marismortui]|uniref:Putative transposase n=1 Tax=Orenia marismortui TaxID=46469 RepID=A0A4R8HFZ7_9FIRM|nr:RNA-guided endonuclease TnpB family protein [Orenia marismortui]TDX59030.1 putative transposase [Orenia marismortui]